MDKKLNQNHSISSATSRRLVQSTHPAPQALKSLFDCKVYTVNAVVTAHVNPKASSTEPKL